MQHVAMGDSMTIYNAAEQKALLFAQYAEQPLRVDLSQVMEIDTAGLQLLLLLQREMADRGLPLHMTGAGSAVQDICQLLNVQLPVNAAENNRGDHDES